MVQVSSPVSRKSSLKQFVADTIVDIDRLGYSRRSRNRYRATWGHLVEFADRKQLGDELSEDLVARFLEDYRVGDDELGSGDGWRRHLVWGVKVPADFNGNGVGESAGINRIGIGNATLFPHISVDISVIL